MRSVSIAIAALVTLSCGCVSSSGDLDGAPMNLKSGFFYETDSREEFSGTEVPGQWLVQLSSLPNWCGKAAEFGDRMGLALDGSDVEAAWADIYGEDFWYAELLMVVEDTHSSQSGAFLDGVAWDESIVNPEEFRATLWHFTSAPDEAYWEGTGTWDDFADVFVTDAGTVKITRHTIDRRIGGKLNAPAVWFDDDEEAGEVQGQVDITFEVGTCVEMFY